MLAKVSIEILEIFLDEIKDIVWQIRHDLPSFGSIVYQMSTYYIKSDLILKCELKYYNKMMEIGVEQRCAVTICLAVSVKRQLCNVYFKQKKSQDLTERLDLIEPF